jgi:quinol monooxygenase YgiN
MSSAPVTVVALIRVKPGSEDTALAALTPVAEQTHEERGCVKYALHRSTVDPQLFVLVELWASPADLDAHFLQPYMGELLSNLADHVTEPPAIHFLGPVPVGSSPKGTL